MRIWLICAYGPVPGEAWREYRIAALGRVLAERGHEVVWFTASFAHHFKRQRVEKSTTRSISPGFSIRFIHTTGYRRHVGLGRLLFESVFALKLFWQTRGLDRPDAVISGDTTMGASQVAIALARRYRAKLIVDVMDLWPELFAAVLPDSLRRYESKIFALFYWLRRRAFRNADAITAVSRSYLERALEVSPLRANRAIVAYIGVDVKSIQLATRSPDREPGLPAKKADEVYAIYAGSLGNTYDIGTLLEACKILEATAPHVSVVVAGNGPKASELEQCASQKRPSNLIFLGVVTPEKLARIYGMCDIGLSLYSSSSTVAIPVKVFDYLAAGLPIINSLRGELEILLRTEHCGVHYIAGEARSLASAIEALANDRPEREKMAMNCARSAEKFDSRFQYSKISDLVEDVCRERGLASA